MSLSNVKIHAGCERVKKPNCILILNLLCWTSRSSPFASRLMIPKNERISNEIESFFPPLNVPALKKCIFTKKEKWDSECCDTAWHVDSHVSCLNLPKNCFCIVMYHHVSSLYRHQVEKYVEFFEISVILVSK